MELSTLKVLPAKEKQFAKKNILSVEDLLYYFPKKYNDFLNETGIMPDGEISCIVVRVNNVRSFFSKVSVVMANCTAVKSGENVTVSWFNQEYIEPRVRSMLNEEVYVVGKATYNEQYKNYSIAGPLVFTNNIQEGKKIYPVYPKIPGMSEDYLNEKINTALSIFNNFNEPFPERIVKENNLLPYSETVATLHRPKSMNQLEKAQNRMIFNDLLYFSLRLETASRLISSGSQYNVKNLKITNQIIENLPFALTPDQKTTVDDIINKMRLGQRINALVQGDVGCGKTIVAFLLAISMVDSGYQAAIMAPTQVLAKQHYNELVRLVEPYGVQVGFLGAGMKKKERTAIVNDVSSGKINILVGTHAVIGSDVNFKDLGLVIVDEEHKFGVLQRQELIKKASNGVHSVTMSATPIPRSLAQVIYGTNVDLYTIKSMPNGRKPIKTCVTNNINAVFKFLYKELSAGRQAYIVCPMIDKNEDMEGVKSVEEISEIYKRDFADKNGFKIATLSGRCKKEETEEIINDFKNKKTDILISTTVIEVGVNVPNATTIIIHNAERFGLSGLHQLRGRVGRGDYQSYCVLFSEKKDNERLNVMVDTTDGFKIAEADLKLRGTGELIGTKQSGDDLYVTLMLTYPDVYKKTRAIASELIDSGEDVGCFKDRKTEEKEE